MDHFNRNLILLEDLLNVATFSIMLTLAFANVVSRFVLQASLAFTDEFVTVLFDLCSFAGASVAQRNRSHLGLDFVTSFMPRKIQKALSIFGNIMALVFLSILFYYGCLMVQQELHSGQLSATMQWPEWIYGMTVPVGAGLMILRYLIDTYLKGLDLRAEGGA